MHTGERVRAAARNPAAHDVQSRTDRPDAEREERRDLGAREESAALERIALTAIAAVGEPLRPDVRSEMESRLRADLGSVRVHTGGPAARAARLLDAEAFTVGEDVVFGAGMYAPHDAAGRHRLAHELAHVLQQRSGAARAAAWGVSAPGDALERAADEVADKAADKAADGGNQSSAAPAADHASRTLVPGALPAASVATPVHPRVIQRRALLFLSPSGFRLPPSSEAASDAAADSPWLGLTAPGMIDFTGPTPKLTPTPEEAAAASKTEPSEPAPASQLDPSAVPEREPTPPAPPAPGSPEADLDAAAKAADASDAEALAAAQATFPDQKIPDRKTTDFTNTDLKTPDTKTSAPATETGHPAPDHLAPAAEPHPAAAQSPAAQQPAAAAAKPGAKPAPVPLQLPKFADDHIAEAFAPLVAADRDGQRGLQSAVDKSLLDIGAYLDKESARVDEGLKTARGTVADAIKQARGRVQGAAAGAGSRVDRRRTEQGDRATAQLDTKKNAVPAAVETIAVDVEDIGTKKANAAQDISEAAAKEFEGKSKSYQKEARDAGENHAGTAYSDNEDPEIQRASISAQRQAAHDVAEQTANAVADAIDAAVKDWRSGGPALCTAVADQLKPATANVRSAADKMQSSMTVAGIQLAASLNAAAFRAHGTIEQTAHGLLGALAAIERQTDKQLKSAADTMKAGLAKARTDAAQELHATQAEFVTAAHAELAQKLALVSSRPVRRALARQFAGELRGLLRHGYGLGVQQANQLAGRVAGRLTTLLAQFHQQLAAATQPATAGAEDTAKSAANQLAQLQKLVLDYLSSTTTDTLLNVDTGQTDRLADLGKTPGEVDDKLGGLLTDTRSKVDAAKKPLDDDVRAKVDSLGERLDQAMTKAHDKAEYGDFGAWLADQLRSLGKALITPSFWVGLLVGLLITILIVATFGGGAVVLIVAGVVAGAISAAASYTAQCFLDPLVDPKAAKKWDTTEFFTQMAIGGVAGGIGAATGGLASAGVNALVSNVASRVVVDKVAQTVVGAALGAVQNAMTDEHGKVHWQFDASKLDEGLLTNLVVSGVMSHNKIEERIGKIQDKARSTMVEKGLAKNVTPEEHAAAAARLEEKAEGVAAPKAGAGVLGTADAEPHPPTVPDLSGIKIGEGPVPPPPKPAELNLPPAPPEPHLPELPKPDFPKPELPKPDLPKPDLPKPEAPKPEAAKPDVPKPKPKKPTSLPEKKAPTPLHAPEHEGGGPRGPREYADLTDMVMSGDKPMTEAEARQMYETARDQEPHNEFAVVRNTETGEHVVIQGNTGELNWHESQNSSMHEFLQDAPGGGRWELVEHSHGVDPKRGVTPEGGRFPSGRNADYAVLEHESAQRGNAPVEQKIGIVTERGKETVGFGFDPNHEQPYSLRYPGPDPEHPFTVRFGSMEEYGKWVNSHPGLEKLRVHFDEQPGAGKVNTPKETAAPETAVPKPGQEDAVPAPKGAEPEKPAPAAEPAEPAEHEPVPAEPAAPKPATPAKEAPPEFTIDAKGNLHGPDGKFFAAGKPTDMFFADPMDTKVHALTPEGQQKVTKAQEARAKAEEPLKAANGHVDNLVADLSKAHHVEVKPAELAGSKARDAATGPLLAAGVPPEKVEALMAAAEKVSDIRGDMRDASAHLGMVAGEDYLTSSGFEKVSGNVDARGTSGTADLIGVSKDGEKLLVVEAKGGTADLGEGRKQPDGPRLRQGSVEYLEDLLHRDPHFGEYLEKHPEFRKKLLAGDVVIEYTVVSAKADGTVTATPLSLHGEKSARTPVGGHEGAVHPLDAGESLPENRKAVIGVMDDPKGERGPHKYHGRALDQMRDANLGPTVVDNAIHPENAKPLGNGKTAYVDPVNNVTVVTDASGQVVEVWRGARPVK